MVTYPSREEIKNPAVPKLQQYRALVVNKS